ncbi:gluconate 2-dehydrogenase subunit 3 family protein [Providencia rettgeri]|nr:gluconate 2-dehydrogenase subunit 3 family protein [Providencia rettgeri]
MSKNENVPPRRIFLKKTLAILPLTALGSNFITMDSLATTASDSFSSLYSPLFFNEIEWQFVLAATDRLIPADQYGPGAVDEGVPIFIDKQMEQPYGYGHLWYMQGPFMTAVPELGYQSSLTPRDLWRRGIHDVNSWCQKHFNNTFAALETTKQDEVLTQLENDTLVLESVSGALFFTQLIENTKEGYLSDPVHGGNQTMASWKLIGFPGARADYQQVMDNPGKPYPLGPVSISGKKRGI